MDHRKGNKPMKKIWTVEDDSSIRDIILYTLSSCGFESRGFEDGASFLQALEQEEPDLVLLDVMLPGISGLQVLQEVHQRPGHRLPVIMTTARSMESDIIQALDQGADDYLIKPFGMMEMVARIKAVLRRTGREEKGALELNGLFLDEEAHAAFWKGTPLDLTRKEFELLRLFMKHPGRAFTREELMDRVWNTDFAGETRTVDVHIRSLRGKLSEAGEWIETIRGVGYRMRKPA